MKRYFIIAFTAILMSSCISGRLVEVAPEPVTSTFEFEDNQEELYIKSNSWMVKTFTDSKSVIQFSDKESGTIIGKYLVKPELISYGLYGTQTKILGDVSAIITIQVKDKKAKISIVPNNFMRMSGVDKLITKEDVEDTINYLVANYAYSIKNDDSTDW